MFHKKDYFHLKDQIVEKVKKDGINTVSEYSALTAIPLTVIYEIVADELPEHKEYCEYKIKQIKQFFGF